MALNVGELEAVLRLKDEMSAGLANATKNSGAFSTFFDGNMALVGKAAGIAIAGITAIGTSVIALASLGADVNDVSGTFDKFSGSVEASKQIMDGMREASLGTVDDFTMMKTASKLLGAGVTMNADEMKTLTGAAFELQNRGLGPTKEMLDLVSEAMITGKTKALAKAAGVIEGADAEVLYANSMGRTVASLTDSEKAEAKRISIMALLNKITNEAGPAQRDFGEQIEFAEASARNFTTQIASMIAKSPKMADVLDRIGKAFTDAFSGSTEDAVDAIANGLIWFAEAAGTVIETVIKISGHIFDFTKFLLANRDTIGEVAVILGALAIAYNASAISAGIATAAATISATAMTALGAATAFATSPFGLIAIAILAVYAALKYFGVLDPVIAFMKDLGTIIGGVLVESFKWLWEIIKPVGEFIGMVFVGYIKALSAPLIYVGSLLMDTLIPAFKSVAGFVHGLASAFGLSKEKTDELAKSTAAAADPTNTLGVATAATSSAIKTQAQRLKESKEQADAHAKAIEDAAKAADEQSAAMKELNTYSKGYVEILSTVSPKMQEVIAHHLATGRSVDTIAKAYPRLSVAQVDAVNKSIEAAKTHKDMVIKIEGGLYDMQKNMREKDAAEALVLANYLGQQMIAGIRLLSDIKKQNADADQTRLMSDLQRELVAIQKTESDKLKSWDASMGVRTEFEAEVRRQSKASADALKIDNDAIRNNTIAAFTELAAKAQATYDAMAAAPKGTYLPATLEVFKQIADDAAAKANGTSQSWGGALDKMMESLTQFATIAGDSFAGWVQNVSKAIAGTRALVDTVKAIDKAFDMGSAAFSKMVANIKAGKDAFDGFKAASISAGQIAATAFLFIGQMWVGMLRETKAQNEETAAQWQQFLANMKINTQKAFETMLGYLDTYHIAWSQLSNTLRDGQIQAAIADIMVAYYNLAEAGVSSADALKAMGGDINHLLIKIAESGGIITPVMMPMIEQMMELGLVSEEAMRAMLGLTDTTMPKFKEMEAAANKYGIELKDLGPQFQQAKLDELFKTYASDFDLLIAGGADMGAVLDKMGPQVNANILQAIKFGTTIPDSMRPMIQAMMDAGKLVDENGNKLTDMGALNFSQPLEQTMAELVKLFKEFIEQIKSSKDYIDKIPRVIPINIKYDDPGLPGRPSHGGNEGGPSNNDDNSGGGASRGGIVVPNGVQYLAHGGPVGTDTVSAWLTPGEGIVSRNGMAALSDINNNRLGRQDDGELRAIRSELRASQQRLENLFRSLPRAIAVSTRDAILLKN